MKRLRNPMLLLLMRSKATFTQCILTKNTLEILFNCSEKIDIKSRVYCCHFNCMTARLLSILKGSNHSLMDIR